MKRILLATVLGLVLLYTPGLAQEKTVSGKVTSSEDGSPIPGVNILVKGTATGTTTNIDGTYTLAVPGNTPTLVFTFVGFKSTEHEIGGRTTIDIALEPDSRQLSEVVVVGYGTQIKHEMTGNVASIKGADIQNQPVPTFEQSLQGRAAGVYIEAGNGKLGQGIKVRVRGSSSVSAGNQPLYVIDGVPITSQSQSNGDGDTNPLTDISPTDIQSIEILKDASASAIYGSRAANGVVLVTTKRGRSGKTNFSFGYFTGVSNPTHHRKWLNTEQYVELFNEARKNSNHLGIDDTDAASLASRFTRYAAGSQTAWSDPNAPDYTSTTWEDQVFRTGSVNQMDLSASGGGEKTSFYASGSYSNQEGILINNKLQRISTRLNIDHKATDKLSLGVNFSLTRTVNNRLGDDNEFSTPMQIVALSPMTPVIDPRTGFLSGVLDLNTGLPNSNYPLYFNPLIDANYSTRKTTVFRNLGTAFGTYTFTKNLSLRAEVGYDLLNQHEDKYWGKENQRNISTPNGSSRDSWTQVFNYTTNTFLRYAKNINDVHNIEVIAGMSYQESNRDYSNVEGQQFPSNSYRETTSAATITVGSTQETSFSFLSYFARANYKLNERYLFGLSGRVDGSSRFGKSNRYGFFPAASAGWILTEESFLEDNSTIAFLKLRASYGLTGNAEIDNFASRGLYSGDAGYAGVPGQRPSQLENPDLKWEQTAQVDVGIDFGLFNNRITGEIDYYEKHTSDLLLNVNLPGNSGYDTQTRNVGKLENKGVEFVLNTDNVVAPFRWSTSFNIAHNTNKITNLNGQVIQGDFLSRAVEGEAIGIFYGPKYAGVDVNNGDALYYVRNADGTLSKTNDYNTATYMKIGNPNPKFIGGITNTFSYKGIDLSILFQGVFGNDIYNGGGKFMSANGDFFDNQTTDQLRRWQNPGDITDVPQARLYGANGTGESSRYVSDGSYVRLKTVTLGYNIPSSIITRMKLTKARIYASAQNLATFTNYRGWDPEVNSDTYASNINQGIDFYSAPQARSITFGINLGF